MAGLLDGSADGHAAIERASPAANTFIATVYLDQATRLLNQGLFADSEGYFREVLRLWPDHAGALNNLGTAVLRLGRIQEAEAHHRRALALKPDDLAILNNLGNALWQQGRLDEALDYYERAVEISPESSAALVNLGVTLSDLGKFDEGVAFIRESIRLQPEAPDSHVNLGMALARQGHLDEALECYEEALRRRPDFPEARRNRSYVWLASGDFVRGWPEYEWRLKCPNLRLVTADSPRWAGADINGQTILLIAEQGLGDTLHFIRYTAVVKNRGARVLVACPEPLIRLVARCPGVDLALDWKSPLPNHDCHAYLLSLPAILGTTLANLPAEVPYLSADAKTVAAWRTVVARALGEADAGATTGSHERARVLRIGVAWQGNPDHKNDRWRSFLLTYLAHLATVPCVRLISLQKGYGTDQLVEVARQVPVATVGLDGEDDAGRRDFLDTAAVMSEIDLVITLDSAVAHLAGGLGVPVWVALPTICDWRWLIERDDSPWYPTMRLFRQTTPGDWEGVFKRMADALANTVRPDSSASLSNAG
jgi:tetratricopeptide (TPR) repeat protein